MDELRQLFQNNRRWVDHRLAKNPQFFQHLANQQQPKYLWIGCSDSRIPANQVVGLDPGEVFVHRNVANLVVNTDFNCLSVLQYAVDFLAVKYVIVCGHYGCGGVKASMERKQHGLVDNWLRNIRDVYSSHKAELDGITDETKRYDRLCELNVERQVLNVCNTTIVQNAWARGQVLSVHGWVYNLSDGLLRDLDLHVSSLDQVDDTHLTHQKLDLLEGL